MAGTMAGLVAVEIDPLRSSAANFCCDAQDVPSTDNLVGCSPLPGRGLQPTRLSVEGTSCASQQKLAADDRNGSISTATRPAMVPAMSAGLRERTRNQGIGV